uniref:Uncharacterized protein n=1 Tax=Anguilla anguilla TaxID=7936 RepID=A0A0E9Q997_ANGAN
MRSISTGGQKASKPPLAHLLKGKLKC